MKKYIPLIFISLAIALTGCTKKNSASTPAQVLKTDFEQIVSSQSNIPLDDLVYKLISNPVIEFAPAAMPVEEGYLNGFDGEIRGFSEGYFFGPMIGSIPFAGYVFKTSSPKDLLSVLKSNYNLRWNICTEADEMVMTSTGNYVFFIMAPTSFDME